MAPNNSLKEKFSASKPKISVAMTTFNGSQFLEKQIDSILNQTHPVNEIIVFDDRSSDGTLDLLEKYSQNPILHYFVNEKNLGFVSNFENALKHCSGDYILLADQDDVWYPDKVEVLLRSISDNLLIHSDCDLIDANGRVIHRGLKGQITTHQSAEDFLFANLVTGCTVMIRRDLLDLALPFPKGISYHDWYLALIAASKKRITYLPVALTGYRQHEAQDTGSGSSGKSSILKNCLSRLRGDEFLQITSTKKQVSNLKASLARFSDDVDFHSKQLAMIAVLEDYISHFFHFSYGFWYAKIFTTKGKLPFRRIYLCLKYSIG